MSKRLRLPWLALCGLTALALTGCGSSSSQPESSSVAASSTVAGSGSAAASSRTVHVTLSDDGCSPASISVPTGSVTFAIVNSGSSAVTELELLSRSGTILGERENIVPGISASFTRDLKPGRYVLSCPNGAHHAKVSLVVTG